MKTHCGPIHQHLNPYKVAYIKKDPEVHLTAGVSFIETTDSHVQIQGNAQVLRDAETKKKRWHGHHQYSFCGPGDPDFSVLKITPYCIGYQKAAPLPSEAWEA